MDTNEARSYLLRISEEGFQFAHVVAGINAGLFDAIARFGETGALPQQLAEELDYCGDYVRVWCEFGYSLQILDHAGDGRFRLSEAFKPLLTSGSPGALAGSFRIRQVMVEDQLAYPEFLRSGEVCSYQDHGERLTRAVADGTIRYLGPLVEHVYGKLPEVRLKREQGARLLEVGCGKGRILPALAERFPRASFVGIDIDGCAIEEGQQEVESKGLAHCIRLQRVGAEGLDFHEEFDIVSLFATMHELPAQVRPEGVARMCRALRPGGVLISTDFYYPSALEDFRKPEHQLAVRDQAAEVMWGNRHLSREQLAELFASAGFERSEFRLTQFPGVPSPFLTSLAYR